MTVTATPPSMVTGRHAAVLTTIGMLIFLGITATAGGVALVLGIGVVPPEEWLADVPVIDTWVVPGLVLGLGFGLGSLLVAYGMLRRPRWARLSAVERSTHHHWSWIAAIAIGIGHVVWIIVELVYLPELSALQAIYGAVGIVLVLLPLHPAVRRYTAVERGCR